MNKMRLIALLGVMTCGMLMPARADIVVSLVSTVGCGAGCFTWTYDAFLTTGEETSETEAGVAGSPFSTFFTVYDISGLLGSITNPGATGWTNSTQNLGTTPSGIAPTDSASFPNITWVFSPASQVTGPVDLGHFSFNSSQGNNGALISYSQQATKDNPGLSDDDLRQAGLGQVVGPSASAPEPMTLSMMGLGLLGLGLMRRRQVKK